MGQTISLDDYTSRLHRDYAAGEVRNCTLYFPLNRRLWTWCLRTLRTAGKIAKDPSKRPKYISFVSVEASVVSCSSRFFLRELRDWHCPVRPESEEAAFEIDVRCTLGIGTSTSCAKPPDRRTRWFPQRTAPGHHKVQAGSDRACRWPTWRENWPAKSRGR